MNPAPDTAGAARAVDEDAVEIRVPADTRYLAVVRLAAAGLISDADPDVEVAERLQLAVNEVLALLIETSAPGAVIEVGMASRGDTAVIRARSTRPSGDGAYDPDPLTMRVLEATTHSYGFDPDGSAHLVVPVGGD